MTEVPKIKLDSDQRHDCATKALMKILQQEYEAFFRVAIARGDLYDSRVQELIEGFRSYRSQSDSPRTTHSQFWCSVSCSPGAEFSLIRDVHKKVINSAPVRQGWYALEQRSESVELMGSGIHSHFVLDMNTPQTIHAVRKAFTSKFKKIMDVSNSLFFKIKPAIKDDNYYLDYIDGIYSTIADTPEKALKREHSIRTKAVDVIWRKSVRLPKIIFSDKYIDNATRPQIRKDRTQDEAEG